jgi:uncharacterized protein
MNIFNKEQVGYADTNRGILFVIAVQDHKYRVQLGDGYKNTQINEDNIDSYVFTDNVTDMLQDNNYYGAIDAITTNMAGLLSEEVNLPSSLASYGKAFQAQLAEQKAREEKREAVLKVAVPAVVLVMVAGTTTALGISAKKNKEQQRKINEVKNILSIEFGFDNEKEALRVSDDELAKAFVKTNEPITESNIRQFLSTYKNNLAQIDSMAGSSNSSFHDKFYDASHGMKYNTAAMALEMTRREPYRIYNSNYDLFNRLMMYNMFSNIYWNTGYSQVYASEHRSNNDFNNFGGGSSGGGFSGFGGGGFSSGGGASGSW